MNPSFMAFALGIGKYRGGKSPPKPSEQFAFAKGKGVQQEASGPEKEAKVRAHLDKLAAECKQRYLRSDMVEAMEEERDAGSR